VQPEPEPEVETASSKTDVGADSRVLGRRNSLATAEIPSGHICFYNVRLGKVGAVLSVPFPVLTCALSPDGVLLVRCENHVEIRAQLDLVALYTVINADTAAITALCRTALALDAAESLGVPLNSSAASTPSAAPLALDYSDINMSTHEDYLAALRNNEPPAVQLASPVLMKDIVLGIEGVRQCLFVSGYAQTNPSLLVTAGDSISLGSI